MQNRLLLHGYENNFEQQQFGSMPQKSCEDAINHAILTTEKYKTQRKFVL